MEVCPYTFNILPCLLFPNCTFFVLSVHTSKTFFFTTYRRLKFGPYVLLKYLNKSLRLPFRNGVFAHRGRALEVA